MFLNIFFFVAVMALSLILRPKMPETQPPATEDIGVPTAEAGKPITVVFGTVLVTGPNIVWYGDLGYSPVRTKSGK